MPRMPPAHSAAGRSIDAAAAKPGPDGRLRWTDRDVSYQRAYRYQISLINDHGLSVSLSDPVIAKVYPGPVAPVGLTAIAQQRGILIRWNQAPKDIEGKPIDPLTLSFRVQRLSGTGAWKDVSPLVKGDAYFDQEITPGQSSTYRVLPVRYMDGENVYGEPSSGVFPPRGRSRAPPPPPSKVWTIPAHGVLEVHWIRKRRENRRLLRLSKAGETNRPAHGKSRAAPAFYRSRRPQPGERVIFTPSRR